MLRPFGPDDAEAGRRYRDDEEFARFLPHIPQPFTDADAERWIASCMKGPWDRYPDFAIELDGILVGEVNVEIDAEKRTAMIGYSLSRAHWGRGITVEAARAVIAWGFETLGLATVWASTDARHSQSLRVMEKLGMHYDRTEPNHHVDRDGHSIDEVVYTLTQEQWAKAGRG